MVESSPVHWHPGAAYLYILHLDSPALAWEYLRRNPDYRRDWQQQRRHSQHEAQRWGLSLLENPARDARDATLPMPKLILHALQVNMNGGRLPEPESNGRRYIKLPLDVLTGADWG